MLILSLKFQRNLMIKHSSVYHLLTFWPSPITEICIELYGWQPCDYTTEMR